MSDCDARGNWPIEVLPGTSRPAPALMTAREAAVYLRLATSQEADDHAERVAHRLHRLVDKGFIRPCLVGGKRLYARRELDRFIAMQTERYGEPR